MKILDQVNPIGIQTDALFIPQKDLQNKNIKGLKIGTKLGEFKKTLYKQIIMVAQNVYGLKHEDGTTIIKMSGISQKKELIS
jgi:hypothetical protein